MENMLQDARGRPGPRTRESGCTRTCLGGELHFMRAALAAACLAHKHSFVRPPTAQARMSASWAVSSCVSAGRKAGQQLPTAQWPTRFQTSQMSDLPRRTASPGTSASTRPRHCCARQKAAWTAPRTGRRRSAGRWWHHAGLQNNADTSSSELMRRGGENKITAPSPTLHRTQQPSRLQQGPQCQ